MVVLYLRLPEVRDLSLLAEIRSRWPNAPVVVMTAHGSANDEAEATRLGAYRVMGKPFDVTEMVQVVAAAWTDHQTRNCA